MQKHWSKQKNKVIGFKLLQLYPVLSMLGIKWWCCNFAATDAKEFRSVSVSNLSSMVSFLTFHRFHTKIRTVWVLIINYAARLTVIECFLSFPDWTSSVAMNEATLIVLCLVIVYIDRVLITLYPAELFFVSILPLSSENRLPRHKRSPFYR